jgi:hypothetical protein
MRSRPTLSSVNSILDRSFHGNLLPTRSRGEERTMTKQSAAVGADRHAP